MPHALPHAAALCSAFRTVCTPSPSHSRMAPRRVTAAAAASPPGAAAARRHACAAALLPGLLLLLLPGQAAAAGRSLWQYEQDGGAAQGPGAELEPGLKKVSGPGFAWEESISICGCRAPTDTFASTVVTTHCIPSSHHLLVQECTCEMVCTARCCAAVVPPQLRAPPGVDSPAARIAQVKWRVTAARASPDCFPRTVYLVNGAFQPVLEVEQGQKFEAGGGAPLSVSPACGAQGQGQERRVWAGRRPARRQDAGLPV